MLKSRGAPRTSRGERGERGRGSHERSWIARLANAVDRAARRDAGRCRWRAGWRLPSRPLARSRRWRPSSTASACQKLRRSIPLYRLPTAGRRGGILAPRTRAVRAVRRRVRLGERGGLAGGDDVRPGRLVAVRAAVARVARPAGGWRRRRRRRRAARRGRRGDAGAKTPPPPPPGAAAAPAAAAPAAAAESRAEGSKEGSSTQTPSPIPRPSRRPAARRARRAAAAALAARRRRRRRRPPRAEPAPAAATADGASGSQEETNDDESPNRTVDEPTEAQRLVRDARAALARLRRRADARCAPARPSGR